MLQEPMMEKLTTMRSNVNTPSKIFLGSLGTVLLDALLDD